MSSSSGSVPAAGAVSLNSWDDETTIASLQAIEAEVDVNGLTWNGVSIWPYMRLRLWDQMLRRHEDSVGRGQPSDPILEAYQQGQNGELPKPVHSTPMDNRDGPIVLVSHPHYYTDCTHGKYINRHVDPLYSWLNKSYSTIKWECTVPTDDIKLPRYYPTIWERVGSDFWRHIQEGQSRMPHLSGDFSGLIRATERHGQFKPNLSVIAGGVLRFEAYQRHFDAVLKVIRPQCVLLPWYYDFMGMGLIHACKKLGIPTADVQHGKQGRCHGMYTFWTQMPPEGYDLLPDYFWTWGQPTAVHMLQGRPDEARNVNLPVVGGNAWLAQWVDGDLYVPMPEDEAFLSDIKKFKARALVSLQPLDDPLPDALCEAMSQLPEVLWLLRLHPQHLTNPNRKISPSDLVSQCKARGIKHVEVEKSSALPLYSLLRRSTHHLTGFSSVCYEALAFGMISAIWHPTGISLYTEEIAQGKFFACETVNDFLGYLNAVPALADTDSAYIETSESFRQQAIMTILAGPAS